MGPAFRHCRIEPCLGLHVAREKKSSGAAHLMKRHVGLLCRRLSVGWDDAILSPLIIVASARVTFLTTDLSKVRNATCPHGNNRTHGGRHVQGVDLMATNPCSCTRRTRGLPPQGRRNGSKYHAYPFRRCGASSRSAAAVAITDAGVKVAEREVTVQWNCFGSALRVRQPHSSRSVTQKSSRRSFIVVDLPLNTTTRVH